MSFSMAAATILATDPTPICTTTEPGLIGTITDWLIMLMETIGGIGVALAIALESIFPPIPSEVILPLSGFTGRTRHLEFAGRNHLGHHRLRTGCLDLVRHLPLGGPASHQSRGRQNPRRQPQRREQSQRLVHQIRHMVGAHRPRDSRGTLAVSIPAGFNRMNFLHFTGWTLLGSAVWNTILVSAGYLLGDQWCSIQGALGVFEDVVIVAVIVIIVWFVVRKVRTVIRNRKSSDGNE